MWMHVAISRSWLGRLVTESTSATHLWAASWFQKSSASQTVVTWIAAVVAFRWQYLILAMLQITFHSSCSRPHRLIKALKTCSLTLLQAGVAIILFIKINGSKIWIRIQFALLNLQIPLVFSSINSFFYQLLVLSISCRLEDHFNFILAFYGVI